MESFAVKADPPEIPAEELVRKAQDGDESALSGLIDRFQKGLYRFSLYLTGDPKTAEDLCQDTLIRVLTQLKKLKDPTKFQSWLFRIAKNLFWDHLRSLRRTEMLPEELPGPSNSADLHLQITRVLVQMEPPDRLLLLLVDLHGYSYREAAETLEISVEAVTSRIYRARETFAGLFDGHERKLGG